MDKTIEISDELVKAAQELTGETDERAAVEKVLRSHLNVRSNNAQFLDLIKKVDFASDFDPKTMRFSRHDLD